MPASVAITNTIAVVMSVSRRVGQVTFAVSWRTSCRNLNGLTLAIFMNPHRPVQRPIMGIEPFCRALSGDSCAAEVRQTGRRRHLLLMPDADKSKRMASGWTTDRCGIAPRVAPEARNRGHPAAAIKAAVTSNLRGSLARRKQPHRFLRQNA